MSDNIRRYRSIRRGLAELYPCEPKGNLARHLNTLAAMISGIVGSKSSNLPHIATKVADSRKPESRVKTFSRWLSNDGIDYETYYLPFVEYLLLSLLQRPLALVIDASAVGRNCMTLVVSVLYKNRALPIAWLTRRGKKGHHSEAMHLELIKCVKKIIPAQASVIFLGDGEFDAISLIKTVESYGWNYACRTAKNRHLQEDDEAFSFQKVGVGQDTYFSMPRVSHADDPSYSFHAIVWWEQPHEEPVYLMSNIALAREAIYWYKKRYHIETFFSDKKSRGFNLHKSHISDPDRLNNLMIATCLAYIWMVFLGVWAIKNGWHTIIHRTDRCDLSLFQLGIRMMEFRLNRCKRIPVGFQLNLFE